MNARWVGFSVLAILLGMAGAYVNWAADLYKMPQLLWCGGTLWLLVLPLLWQAGSEYLLNYRQQNAWILKERQRALAMTPQTVLAEAMRQMHPSAIDVLAMYGRMSWMILPGAEPDSQVEWVLYGTKCTYEFISDFLSWSTQTTCVPERQFANDGAKKYAPHGMMESWCSDREQHQQFTAYLYGLGRITKTFGNQPAAWVGPWNPENIAKTMGIKFEYEAVEEDDAIASQVVNVS